MIDIYRDYFDRFPRLSEQELRGTEGMEVKLISSSTNPYFAILMGQSASWRPWKFEFTEQEARDTLDGMASGKIWTGQALEAVSFTFAIKNISRACTHQFVRTRIGAGFMQESGREGTWDESKFITPLTILENAEMHQRYVDDMKYQLKAYRELQNNGIPPQDARSVVGHGIAQNMWVTYNFVSLMGVLTNRLCCNMQWEINTLARMMRDEVRYKFPYLSKLLKSRCAKTGGHKSDKDNTNYYDPGAANNGNKIYFADEGLMCGEASNITQEEFVGLLANEKLL